MNRPLSEFLPLASETIQLKKVHRSISQSRQLISIKERPYSANSNVDVKLRQTPTLKTIKTNSHLHSCEYAAFEAERNGRKRFKIKS